MKKATAACIVALVMSLQSAYALTGQEIMEKNDQLPEARTAEQVSVLAIFKGKRLEKKEFSGVLKKYGEKTRKHMTFRYPTRLEFLVWDEPGEDSLQWIKLSSGKVRKIASSDKGNAWVNSHFYNEDISSYDVSDFNYSLLGEAEANGVMCYKIESKKKKGEQVYSKRIIYVAKDTYVIQRVEFYEKGLHSKTCNFEKIEKIQGIYTPRKVVMERTDGRGKSILYVKTVKYNVPVPDSTLRRESF